MKKLETETTEKVEIIEKALLESVGGAGAPGDDGDFCGFECSIFSIDVCSWDLCSTSSR